MSEKNYDFRQRHWQYHRKNMRDSQRSAAENEVMLDNSWRLGCGADSGSITQIAVKDFQDYLDISMELPLALPKNVLEGFLTSSRFRSIPFST